MFDSVVRIALGWTALVAVLVVASGCESQPRTVPATSSPSTVGSATATPTPHTSTPSPTRTPKTSTARSTPPKGYDEERLDAAVKYAERHDMDSSIAVIDTRTGVLTTAGDRNRLYPTASVLKTLIATRVLLEGRMKGDVETLAYTMITQSDNDAAYDLYPMVGNDELLPWIADHYGIRNLGKQPAVPGLWGGTRITAAGFARFYAAVRADPKVWPWLSHAMSNFQPISTAGQPNDFGLGSLRDVAVKNGWNVGRDLAHPDDAQFNSTGFVDDGRYAVVILSEGPDELYYAAGERVVTAQAKLLFPAR